MTQATSNDADTRHPQARFGSPERLLDSNLPTQEKRRLLEKWRAEEAALIRAASEGMEGGDTPMLGRVKKAIDRLK